MKQETARLPNDLSLERDLIAACLARPETIGTVGVGEEDFALDAHRLLWRSMLDLHELAEPIDLVRLRSKLIDVDRLNDIGGENFLATFRKLAPVKALPVDRLLRLTRLRALRAQAEAVAAAAAGNDPDLASAALEAARGFDADTFGKRPKTAQELADAWYDSLGKDQSATTVSPGLPALKRIVGRLDRGSMTLVGADVNVGKSSLALEMLLGAVLDGEFAGYLSVEDPERIVTERVMSRLGRMSAKRVRRFRPGDKDEDKIDRAMQAMRHVGDRLQVSTCIGMNEREILEQMTMMAKAGCRLVVLDYIGVVGCSVKQQDRRNEVRWIATRFKARASTLGVALVVVSQFQRPKDGDSSREPGKHSFRETGDLEAMAEYAIVMWRQVEDDFAPIYCKLAKSKTGGVGATWTMQRELWTEDHTEGSGCLVEVKHTQDSVYDDHGNSVTVREVMEDPTETNRWKVSARK